MVDERGRRAHREEDIAYIDEPAADLACTGLFAEIELEQGREQINPGNDKKWGPLSPL